jgi:CHAT domain-containing protein/tetratricopeptide (TPR) repeat protein
MSMAAPLILPAILALVCPEVLVGCSGSGERQTAMSSPSVDAAEMDRLRKMLEEGDLPEAERFARLLLEHAEAAEGADAPLTHDVLELLLQVLAAEGKTSGEESAALANRFAQALYGRGRELRLEGDYDASRVLYERALVVARSFFGADDARPAWLLNALGILDDLTGDYAGALARYEEALAIARPALGAGDPFIANCLNNRALVHRNLGEYEESRRDFEEALEITRRERGPDHFYTASTLNNLAELLRITGDLEEARPLFEQALKIQEEEFGEIHFEVATTLLSLAGLHHEMGDLPEAKRLYGRCLDIWRQTLEPGHPDVAYALIGLAAVLRDQGDPATSIGLLQRALRIREDALGADHPLVATVLEDLAGTEVETGDLPAASRAASRAEEVRRNHVRLMAGSLPERQALDYASVIPSATDLLVLISSREEDASFRAAALDAVVQSRALVLDEMARRRRALPTRDDPEVGSLLTDLARESRILANLAIRGPDGLDPARYQGLLVEARERKEEVERRLADRSGEFRRELAMQESGLSAVRAELPAGSAMISYVLTGRPASSRNPTGAGSGNGNRYGAFLTLPADPDPVFVDLGPAVEIDARVAAWLREAATGGLVPEGRVAAAERDYRTAGARLREAVWDPVVARLSGIREIFVVPDGSIHQVNLYALPLGDASYVVESALLLHYLSSERDLIPVPDETSDGSGVLVVGSPAFNDSSALASREGSGRAHGTSGANSDSPSRGSCDLSTIHFTQLAESREEAAEIVELWSSMKGPMDDRSEGGSPIYLHDAAATESAVKRLAPGKRFLHFATHGFFLSDECPSGGPLTRGIGGLSRPGPVNVVPGVENPLLRSGLALAGVNHRSQADPEGEDGVLSAEEVAAMDLRGVRWAVLSACETGRGEFKAGEGILGLRRAFQIAGARTMVMSLWSVQDQATRQWMTSLYRAHLVRGLPADEAAREASIRMLERRRSAGLSTHPFYWGPFVAFGYDRTSPASGGES